MLKKEFRAKVAENEPMWTKLIVESNLVNKFKSNLYEAELRYSLHKTQ